MSRGTKKQSFITAEINTFLITIDESGVENQTLMLLV